MIDKRVYELDYIRGLQQKYASDPGLIERALYAFGLLEAIKSVGMPFCFKGGTSLMLILDKPARLSTDIDILVEPGTDVDGYIEKASQIFPFLNKKETRYGVSQDASKSSSCSKSGCREVWTSARAKTESSSGIFGSPTSLPSGIRNSIFCWMWSSLISPTHRPY